MRIFDLLVAFPRATSHVYAPSYVAVGKYSVGSEIRPGLYLHPTGRVEFPPVRLSSQSVLTFRIGVKDEVWDKPGDGVEFIVFVQRSNDSEAKVFSQYVDPKHNPQDRRWFEGRVPLRLFGDQDVRITLATGPGPANDFSYDAGVWGEPEIMLGSED